MELIERIPIEKIKLLSKISYETFKQYTSKCKSDKERKEYYKNFKSFCTGVIKNRGETKRIYHYTDKSPDFSGGRLFSGGSIQGIAVDFRGFLLNETTTDIDIKNCHPVLLEYVCKLHHIDCPNLSYYIQNRSEILERIGPNAKIEFLKSVNSDNVNRKITDKFFKSFDKECKEIQKKICELEDYKYITKHVQVDKYNWLGSAINRILCVYENNILQIIIKHLTTKGIEICALMFDGCLIYGDYYNDESLLRDLEYEIKNDIGINLTLTYKEHSNLFDPDLIEDNDDDEYSYAYLKEKYEMIYGLAFIQESTEYYLRTESGIYYSYKLYELKQQLAPIQYKKNDKMVSFVESWVLDKNRKTYERVDIIPHDRICPDYILNFWTGFKVSNIEEYETVDIQPFLTHIEIMMNHDKLAYEFFLDWLANLLQYPSSPSVLVNIFSELGGIGKGQLIKLISRIIGENKYQLIDDPSNFFGKFNGDLTDKILIHFDESSGRSLNPYYETLKSKINNETIRIENKGKCAFNIKNMFKYISTTQHRIAFKIKEGDRRIFAIEASEELKGNVAYFEQLNNYIEDPNYQRSFYDFLMARPVKRLITDADFPETQLMKDTKALNTDPVEDFIDELDYGDYTGQTLYEQYCKFIKSSGLEYANSKKQFEMKFSKLLDKYHIIIKQQDKVETTEDGSKHRIRFKLYTKQYINDVN